MADAASSPPGTRETLAAQTAWAATLVLLEFWQCYLLRRSMNLGGEVHRWVHLSCLAAVGSIMVGGFLCLGSSYNEPQWLAGKRVWSLSNYAGGLAITAYVWLMLKAKYEGVKMQAEPPSLRYGLGILWGLSVVTMIFSQTLYATYNDERYLVIQTAYYCFFALASSILLFYHGRILINGLHVVLGNEKRATAKDRWSSGLVLFKKRVVAVGFVYMCLLGLTTNHTVSYWKQGKTPRAEPPPKPTDLAALFLLSIVIWSFWLSRKRGAANARGRGVSLSPRRKGGKKGGDTGSSTTANNNSPSVTSEEQRKEMMNGEKSKEADVLTLGGKEGEGCGVVCEGDNTVTDVTLELVVATDDPTVAIAPSQPDHKSDHEFQHLQMMDRLEVELSE